MQDAIETLAALFMTLAFYFIAGAALAAALLPRLPVSL
jgi:hypothetical protein